MSVSQAVGRYRLSRTSVSYPHDDSRSTLGTSKEHERFFSDLAITNLVILDLGDTRKNFKQ